MTIAELVAIQDQKRKDGMRMPSGAVSLEQASLLALMESVILLAEICIELKRGNEK